MPNRKLGNLSGFHITGVEIVAFRLHLDESAAENRPLRVIPGALREGRLSSEQIPVWKRRNL